MLDFTCAVIYWRPNELSFHAKFFPHSLSLVWLKTKCALRAIKRHTRKSAHDCGIHWQRIIVTYTCGAAHQTVLSQLTKYYICWSRNEPDTDRSSFSQRLVVGEQHQWTNLNKGRNFWTWKVRRIIIPVKKVSVAFLIKFYQLNLHIVISKLKKISKYLLPFRFRVKNKWNFKLHINQSAYFNCEVIQNEMKT